MTPESPISRGTVSTDGRYWWNGRAWVPFVRVEQDPAPLQAEAAVGGKAWMVACAIAVALGLLMIGLSFRG
jgi:hypothetical protein